MESSLYQTSSKVGSATAASSAAVVSWMVSRAALRWGARRLAGVFLGGAVAGFLTAGFFIYQAVSSDTSCNESLEVVSHGQRSHNMDRNDEEVDDQQACCDVCHNHTSTEQPQPHRVLLTCDSATPHTFCATCFNRFVSYGLATEPPGFVFHSEENKSGVLRRPGEIPCPFFGEGCDCHSISALSLSVCLTPENQNVYQAALAALRSEAAPDEADPEAEGVELLAGLRQRHRLHPVPQQLHH